MLSSVTNVLLRRAGSVNPGMSGVQQPATSLKTIVLRLVFCLTGMGNLKLIRVDNWKNARTAECGESLSCIPAIQ